MRVCLTGGTGFLGGHLAQLLVERGDEVRVTFRDPDRLGRLGALEVEPVRADVLDRAALGRSVRGCEVLFHCAGIVASQPEERVWDVNALAPRMAVEAAAAEGVGRVVVTSSVAGIGPQPAGEVGDESDSYRGGGIGLTYADSKHEGEVEALAAGARLGVEVVVVNPGYVLGVPVDRTQPGETSTRLIGNYLRGRLPAVIDGRISFVDVEDVAAGHLAAAADGRPGERYVLGAHNLSWSQLLERVARISGVHHPVALIPPEAATAARRAESIGLPMAISAEAMVLMAQNWCYSSAKARRELGYAPRPLAETLEATIEWYQDLIESGVLKRGRPSAMSLAAAGLRLAGRTGALDVARFVERQTGRRLLAV